MALTTRSRPSKATVTLLGLVLLFLIAFYIPSHRLVESLVAVNGTERGSWSDIKTEPAENAHRLPNADAFLPHFQALLELPHMTLAEAKAGCSWNGSENINFQFEANVDWNQKDRSEEEIENKRQQWQNFVRNDLVYLPYEDYRNYFDGRGIVVVAGDTNTLSRVDMLLKALAKVGSQLPVELHYYDREISAASRAHLASIWPNITFNDLSASANIVKTAFGAVEGRNYQFKTAALVNSHFCHLLIHETFCSRILTKDCQKDSSHALLLVGVLEACKIKRRSTWEQHSMEKIIAMVRKHNPGLKTLKTIQLCD